MTDVWMDMSLLMELLDNYEGGKLYPRIEENDEVLRVKIFGGGHVCFEIGQKDLTGNGRQQEVRVKGG